MVMIIEWRPQAACPEPLPWFSGDQGPLCHEASLAKGLSKPELMPSLLCLPLVALPTQAWSVLLEIHSWDPAMAIRTLMSKGHVSLSSLFPEMTLWALEGLPTSVCALKTFCLSQYWERYNDGISLKLGGAGWGTGCSELGGVLDEV